MLEVIVGDVKSFLPAGHGWSMLVNGRLTRPIQASVGLFDEELLDTGSRDRSDAPRGA